MLVLSRRPNESIVIEGGIRVTVVSIRGNQVRLGFEAPGDVRIFREELLERPDEPVCGEREPQSRRLVTTE
jgi:carbon storage regulator